MLTRGLPAAFCPPSRRGEGRLTAPKRNPPSIVKPPPRQPSPIPLEPGPPVAPASGLTALDRTMTSEDALVYDALCALQAPSGSTRVAEMLAAAGVRTERGAAFHQPEVKRLIDRLLAAGHATRDKQGRLSAAAPHGPARFTEIDRKSVV